MTLQDRIARLSASPTGRKLLTDAVERCEKVVRIATPRGRARGRGQSSKAKGRSAVVWVKNMLHTCLNIRMEDMHVKATSQIGEDLFLSPNARADFPFTIEVKNVERLQIFAALAQAEANATPDYPAVVFFKRANTPMFVAMNAATFMDVLRYSDFPDIAAIEADRRVNVGEQAQ